jgi:hypothetical protein
MKNCVPYLELLHAERESIKRAFPVAPVLELFSGLGVGEIIAASWSVLFSSVGPGSGGISCTYCASLSWSHTVKRGKPAACRQRRRREQQRRRPARILRGHNGGINTVAWSPSGRTLASSGYDGTIRLWDVAGARTFARWATGGDIVNSVAWSSDGKTLASASYASVQIGDAETHQIITSFERPATWRFNVTWSPNGATLDWPSADGPGGPALEPQSAARAISEAQAAPGRLPVTPNPVFAGNVVDRHIIQIQNKP